MSHPGGWFRWARSSRRHWERTSSFAVGVLLPVGMVVAANGSLLSSQRVQLFWNNKKENDTHKKTRAAHPETNKDDDDDDKKVTTRLNPTPSRLSWAAPTSPIRIFSYSRNFQVAYDTRTRNPVYVLERLVAPSTTNDKGGNKKRQRQRPRFFAEPSLSPLFQSRNAHYQGTEYDRGHMAPAADFTLNQNHDINDSDFVQSFCLTNTCPQNSILNRTIWAQLEAWTRRVAQHPEHWIKVPTHDYPHANNNNNNHKICATYVVTGPLWLPKRPVGPQKFQYGHFALGDPPQTVDVPTHFFKLVLVVQEDKEEDDEKLRQDSIPQILAFACFVLANSDPRTWADDDINTNKNNQPRKKKPSSLAQFLVCWTDLEAVTGLEFFSHWIPANNNDTDSHDWKKRANQLTLRELQGTPLLLPSSEWLLEAKNRNNNNNKTNPDLGGLQHLCANGNCLLSSSSTTTTKQ